MRVERLALPELVPVVGVKQPHLVPLILAPTCGPSTPGVDRVPGDFEVEIRLAGADPLASHPANVGGVVGSIAQPVGHGANALGQIEAIAPVRSATMRADRGLVHAGHERRPAGRTHRRGGERLHVAHYFTSQPVDYPPGELGKDLGKANWYPAAAVLLRVRSAPQPPTAYCLLQFHPIHCQELADMGMIGALHLVHGSEVDGLAFVENHDPVRHSPHQFQVVGHHH